MKAPITGQSCFAVLWERNSAPLLHRRRNGPPGVDLRGWLAASNQFHPHGRPHQGAYPSVRRQTRRFSRVSCAQNRVGGWAECL